MDSYTKACFDGFRDVIYRKMKMGNPTIFEEYDSVFPFTNENISSYLTLIDIKSKQKALSVLSSGDHIFNLITLGVTDIDTFDINKLTEYYALGLKRAMILKYSYKDFIKISDIMNIQMGYGRMKLKNLPSFCHRKDIIKEIVLDVASDMDQKYREFWLSVIDYFDSEKIESYISNYLFATACGDIEKNNNYCESEKLYNSLKRNIGKSNINFVASGILNVAHEYKKERYDLILLSNILDYGCHFFNGYWEKQHFKIIEDEFESISSFNADIIYHYLFPWNYNQVINESKSPFEESGIYVTELDEVKLFKTPKSNPETGILLKKVKKS